MAQVLPVRVRPFRDESLSSWFVRLAHANGEKVQTLAHHIWGRQKRYVRLGDLDRLPSVPMQNALASASGTSSSTIRDLSLDGFVGTLWQELETRGTRAWLRPVVDKAHRRLHGQQACPKCLAADPIPYFRKSWRLSLHCVCPEHGCVLIDRCAQCQTPLTVHRGDVGTFFPEDDAGMHRCSECGADHRHAATTPVPEDALLYQHDLLNALVRGGAYVMDRPVPALLFFEGIHMLWSFVDSPGHAGALSIYDMVKKTEVCSKRHGGFDKREPALRLLLMMRVFSYLDEWPHRLIDDMQNAKISGQRLLRFHKLGPHAVPFWLWEPVHWNLDRSMYVPSDAEIDAAVIHEIKRRGWTRIRDVCRLLDMSTNHSARVAASCHRHQALQPRFTRALSPRELRENDVSTLRAEL